MPSNIKTKQYKFKMNNVQICVDIDNSFSIINYLEQAKATSYINNQHYHIVHELFFIEECPLTLFSDNITLDYKDCILSIPPKFSHFSYRQKDYRLLFSFTYDEKNTNNFAVFLKTLSESGAARKLEKDELVMSYVRELSNLISYNDSTNDEIVVSLLKLIFYKIYNLNTHKQNEANLSINESYILKIDNIINSFQDDITLQTVADALHLSTKQASRIITKNYNKPLSALLTEKRLTVASLLLRHTDKTISEIVEYINFPSESYFYLQFKKAYGCTPHKYKKTGQKNNY